jgi:phosphoglycolate phosphatase-like HAD superfamily hydrolase
LKVLGVATGLYPYDELAKYEPDFLLEDFSDNEAVIEIFERF